MQSGRRSTSHTPGAIDITAELRRAAEFNGQRRFSESADIYRRILRSAPNHLQTRNQLSAVLIALEEYTEALRVAEETQRVFELLRAQGRSDLVRRYEPETNHLMRRARRESGQGRPKSLMRTLVTGALWGASVWVLGDFVSLWAAMVPAVLALGVLMDLGVLTVGFLNPRRVELIEAFQGRGPPARWWRVAENVAGQITTANTRILSGLSLRLQGAYATREQLLLQRTWLGRLLTYLVIDPLSILWTLTQAVPGTPRDVRWGQSARHYFRGWERRGLFAATVGMLQFVVTSPVMLLLGGRGAGAGDAGRRRGLQSAINRGLGRQFELSDSQLDALAAQYRRGTLSRRAVHELIQSEWETAYRASYSPQGWPARIVSSVEAYMKLIEDPPKLVTGSRSRRSRLARLAQAIDARLGRELKLDGDDELVIYLAPVGRPA